MAIMRRDLNFGLLVIIIALLVAFAGFSTFYQTTFKNLTSEYKTKLGELDKVTSTLQTEKTKLNQTSYQLKIKSEREADLSGRYSELEDQKEQLKRDKATLTENLQYSRSQLAETRAELDLTKTQLTQAQQTADNYLKQRDNCYDDKDELEEDLDALNMCIADLGVSCP